MTLQEKIAARAVAHIPAGSTVNLGIGIPTFVADLCRWTPSPCTARPGASYFASSASFGMIRGGHVDVAVLGALQIDGRGRIANWAVPGKPVLGVGGAMDLLVGARTVVVTTTHTTKDGSQTIVAEATYPLTAQRSVDVVVTEAATFRIRDGGLVLVELGEGVTLDWVREHTTAPYAVDLPEVSHA